MPLHHELLQPDTGPEDKWVCATNEASPAGSLPDGEADTGRGGGYDWKEGGEEEDGLGGDGTSEQPAEEQEREETPEQKPRPQVANTSIGEESSEEPGEQLVGERPQSEPVRSKGSPRQEQRRNAKP